MPFKRESFVEGGVKGVKEFIGRLDDIEEDVEGKFGPQDAITYRDVEITESAEEVALDEGLFTTWHKHSDRKNSMSGRLAFQWMDFADAHDIASPDDDDLTAWGQLAAAFKDKLVKYRKVTIEFGEDMNPGTGYVPVEVMEGAKGKPASKPSGKPAPKSNGKPASKPEPKAIDSALVKAITAAIGEDGATRDIIRREVVKKAALRTILGTAGGLDNVLTALVEQGTLTESEGFYTKPE